MNNRNLPEKTISSGEESMPETTSVPFRVFNTKDEWQQEINRIIAGRLKDYNELKNKAKEQDEIIARLAEELKNATATSSNLDDNWEKDILKINDDYPDVDLEKLLNDEHFVFLITNGTPCADAFKAVCCDELVENARSDERQIVLANIKARGERPNEIGLAPGSGFGVASSPRHLSSKQIKEIGERVMRGERIVL